MVTKNVTVGRTWAPAWAFALFGLWWLLGGPGHRNWVLAWRWGCTHSLLGGSSMAPWILWVLWRVVSTSRWCTLSIVSCWRHALLVGRYRWTLRLWVAISCWSAWWIPLSSMPCSWWYAMTTSHLWWGFGFHLGWGSLEHGRWRPSLNYVFS